MYSQEWTGLSLQTEPHCRFWQMILEQVVQSTQHGNRGSKCAGCPGALPGCCVLSGWAAVWTPRPRQSIADVAPGQAEFEAFGEKQVIRLHPLYLFLH